MAHVLNITDGITTQNLSSVDCFLLEYSPKTARDGESSVVDAIEVQFYSTSPANVRTVKQEIEQMFTTARLRQARRKGRKVFLNFTLQSNATVYRSEILDGAIDLLPDSVHEAGSSNIIRARVLVTRRFFWEGPRTQIQISNDGGTQTTAGLTIYNHDDGDSGHDDHVKIFSNFATGVLPAPLEIQWENTGGFRQLRNLYIANYLIETATNTLYLEGEAGSASGGSNTANAGYSGGSYISFSVSTGGSTISWTLTASRLQTLDRPVRLLAKFEYSNTVYAKWWLETGGVKVTPVTPEVKFASQDNLQDLGVLPVPPGGYQSDWADMTLVLQLRAASTHTVKCDFVKLMPADELMHRELAFLTTLDIDANDVVIDDGIENILVLQSNTTIIGKLPVLSSRGDPVHIYPGRENWITFSWDGNSFSPLWTAAVKLFYRPRLLLPV